MPWPLVMNERQNHPAEPATKLPWIVAPWLQPFWYAYLAFSWWQAGLAARAEGAAAAGPAALVPLAKLAGCLTETAFYVLWWRGRRRRLPFWRFFAVVAMASLADVLAIVLAQRAHGGGPAARWLAPLVGLGVLGDRALGSPGLRLAFGGLGLLTATRVALTAHAQARALGVRAALALGWTTLVWLLGRISVWWLADLIRGRSPLPIR